MAWKSSLFVNVQNDLVEIKEHGWNPLNYSLLDSDDIKLTMTKNDVIHYKLILKVNNQSYICTKFGTHTIVRSISTSTRTSSEISGLILNENPNFCQLMH